MTRNEAQSLISALVCGTHKECSSNHYRDVALGVNKIYNDFEKELKELNNRSCRNCNYCKEVYSYSYPLCVYNENEPFQIHNKQVLKCDFHKAKGE